VGSLKRQFHAGRRGEAEGAGGREKDWDKESKEKTADMQVSLGGRKRKGFVNCSVGKKKILFRIILPRKSPYEDDGRGKKKPVLIKSGDFFYEKEGTGRRKVLQELSRIGEKKKCLSPEGKLDGKGRIDHAFSGQKNSVQGKGAAEPAGIKKGGYCVVKRGRKK